jgi:hypothetical protein
MKHLADIWVRTVGDASVADAELSKICLIIGRCEAYKEIPPAGRNDSYHMLKKEERQCRDADASLHCLSLPNLEGCHSERSEESPYVKLCNNHNSFTTISLSCQVFKLAIHKPQQISIHDLENKPRRIEKALP